MRVGSNDAASVDAPQCAQNRLPSGIVREQDVHVIAALETAYYFLAIVNFDPETPKFHPSPVPAMASDTSPFVSA